MINKRKIVSASAILLLVMAMFSVSSLLTEVVADSQGILQSGLIPFPIAGSTQLQDGTVLVIKLDWALGNQIWKSVDEGLTWTYVSTLPGSTPIGLEKLYCTDENTILAVDGTFGYQGHIFRSTDEGSTWTVTYTFSSTDEGCPFNIYEDNIGNIYLPIYSSGETMNHAKLLRSTDDGASWQQIAYWPGYRHCHSAFVNKYNGYIYVCLGDGPFALMRSKDNGQTWTNLDSDTLYTSVNGKGDSNVVYLGTDNLGITRIYRFADDGSSNVDLETVWDYGSDESGNVYFLQIVNGKLVFGTSGTCSGLSSGYHCILGVSDSNWNSFSIVEDFIADGPWQGYNWCTISYWNISKIYVAVNVSYGTAFEPSSDVAVSISPITANIVLGGSQQFNSAVTGGVPPNSYQWVLNGTAVSGATGATWTFVPTQTGHFNVYVNVTDSLNNKAQSNIVTDIMVYPQLTASISPTTANTAVGGSIQFNCIVAGGVIPYTYQWVLNGSQVTGATSPTWVFTPASAGTYWVYLNVTDNEGNRVQSNTATLNVNPQLTVVINPTDVKLYYGQSQTFIASVSGGIPPYSYQWTLNGTTILGATSPTWVFTPKADGNCNVYVNVTDSQNNKAQSDTITDINVYSVNLLLTAGTNIAIYKEHQSVTFTVNVLNQLNPPLQSILTLTVTGPNGYYFYDFQPINVADNSDAEYSFDWITPNVAETYTVETGLAPALLTAYDSVSLRVT